MKLRPIYILLTALLAIAGIVTSCVSCAALKDPGKRHQLEAIGAKIIFDSAVAYGTGHLDSAWAISEGLNSISSIIKTTTTSEATALVKDTAMAFAGSDNPAVKTVATQLAEALGASALATPADKAAAVLALARGVQSQLSTLQK